MDPQHTDNTEEVGNTQQIKVDTTDQLWHW